MIKSDPVGQPEESKAAVTLRMPSSLHRELRSHFAHHYGGENHAHRNRKTFNGWLLWALGDWLRVDRRRWKRIRRKLERRGS